jgi:hypothetical protein
MDTWQTAVCAAGILALMYLGGWIWNFLKWRKAKSSPAKIASIKLETYDSKGRIKQVGHELRELTWKGGKRNEKEGSV